MKLPIEPRRLVQFFFTVLVAFAPSGTRYIWRTGLIDGHSVEPGTVSLFGMQLVALAFAIGAFWLAGRKAISELAMRPPTLLAAAVAVLAALSSLRADDCASGLVQAGFVLLGAAVFWAILLFRPDPHQTLVAFVGGALFHTALGAWQFLTQSAFASKWLGMASHSAEELGAFVVETGSGRWLRAYGGFSHPNILGLYVGLGLLACVGIIAFRGHGRHLKFYAFLPLITAGLVFSFSRSAAIAAAVGFAWIAVSVIAHRPAPAYRTVILPSALISLATFATLAFFYADPMLSRATATGRLEDQSLSQRQAQYADASTLLASSPLGGIGVGQMPLKLRALEPGRPWWQYDYVHNVPMLVAVETGIGGILAWLAFIACSLEIIFKRLSLPVPDIGRKKGKPSSGVTAYAACFLAMLAAAMFDHFLWSSWFGQLLFWTVAGLMHAAYLDLIDNHRKIQQKSAA
jgi:O-antigen ligase